MPDLDTPKESLPDLSAACLAGRPLSSVKDQTITFDSKSEVACALTMERYIYGWRCIPGKTFQIPIDAERRVDFKVNNCLIEYHPITLQHEFRSTDAFRELSHAIQHMHRTEADEVISALGNEFAHQYYYRRRYQIDQNPLLRQCELILCSSPQEMYKLVIKRFGGYLKPCCHDYLEEFNSILHMRRDDVRCG